LVTLIERSVESERKYCQLLPMVEWLFIQVPSSSRPLALVTPKISGTIYAF
jgi:hypothetical protein